MDIIKDSMKFFNFRDFYNKADMIKYEYDLLSFKDKRLYKLYIYSNSFMPTYLQDKIWEYLNEPLGSCYYLSKSMLIEYLGGDK